MLTLRRGLSAFLAASLLIIGLPAPSDAAGQSSGASGSKLFQTGKTSSYTTGELIVTYKNGKTAQKVAQKFPHLQSKERTGNTVLVKVTKGSLEEAAKELAQDPNVEYVEPNYIYHVSESTANPVNDSLYKDQWGLPAVAAPQAWDKLTNWKGSMRKQVIVAVVDTGVAADHPDLSGRLLSNGYNAIDDSQNTMDYFGHGTHVSGIIAANTNNRRGVAGVTGTANVKILPIKVLGDDGYGTSLSIAKGIDKAVELGANVINMSLGGQGHSRLMEDAIRKATEQGVIVVVAAGNSGDNAEGYFPAGYSEPITVASIGENEKASSFSNYGSPIDLAAPGEHIVSTTPFNQYEAYDGTSMATPFVAGAAALVELTHPDWSVEQVRHALENTAKDIDQTGFDPNTGHGLLQVASALTYEDRAPLQIVKPGQGNLVFGQVPFQIQVSDRTVTRIELVNEKGASLGTFPLANQTATFDWDSTQVTDGQQLITIRGLNANNQVVGSPERLQLFVKNSLTQGVKVQVTSPEGKQAVGAVVEVVRLNDSPGDDGWGPPKRYNRIFSSYVNNEGLAYIPSSILLKNEEYAALIEYSDADEDKVYSDFRKLQGTAESIHFDLRQTTNVQVQVKAKQKEFPLDHASFYFVPIVDNTELTQCTIMASTDEQGTVNLNVPAGEYQAYAVRYGETGQNYMVEQRVNVGAENSSVLFDLSNTRKLSFSLPKWAPEAKLYLDKYPYGDIGYSVGVPVRNGQSILMTPQYVDGVYVDLLQENDNQLYVYSLRYVDEGLDLSANQRINLSSNPKLKVNQDSDDQEDLVYHPDDFVYLPVQVEFGSQFILQYIDRMDDLESYAQWRASSVLAKSREKNQRAFLVPRKQGFLVADQEEYTDSFEEAWPDIVMSDQNGEEVWREPGIDSFTIPSAYNIDDGLYTLDVDYSTLPLPIQPQRISAKQIQVEMSTAAKTSLLITSPSTEPIIGVSTIVMDDQNQEVSSGFFVDFNGYGSEQVPLSLSNLEVGKTYTFLISGLLRDTTPILLERKVKIRGSEIALDLSQKSTRPSRVELPQDDSLYYEISKGPATIWAPEASSVKYAWIDPGTYQMIVSKTRGKEQFFYQSKLVIKKQSDKLRIQPDLTKMQKVSIAGSKKNTTWLLGVAPTNTEEQDPESLSDEYYYTFKLTPGDTLYLQPADYQFELGKMEAQDDSTTVFLYDTKPSKTKAGYEFKVDPKLNVQLKPDQTSYQPGGEVNVAVNVQDRYHNRLKDVVIIVDEPASGITAPLKMTKTKTGKVSFYAYDGTKREYTPISAQEVRPELSLLQDDNVMDSSKDSAYWTEGSLHVPFGAPAGVYTLKWLANLSNDLVGSSKIEVKEE